MYNVSLGCSGYFYFCWKITQVNIIFVGSSNIENIDVGSHFLVGIVASKIGHYTAWVKGWIIAMEFFDIFEQSCCRKQQKIHNQETGLENRGRLKVLNDTKLILKDYLRGLL